MDAALRSPLANTVNRCRHIDESFVAACIHATRHAFPKVAASISEKINVALLFANGTRVAELFLILVERGLLTLKPRVLIVDDDRAITQQLFWTLCDDFEVLTANDMQSALRGVTIYEPEVSILDLHFAPMLDSPEVGIRILEFIKGHLPQTKVLIISSDSTADTQRACFASGADGFMDKPFDVEHLVSTVRRYAPEHRLDVI